MAALRSIRSRQEVSQFCLIGSELLTSSSPCFSLKRWEVVLDALEKARDDSSILPSVNSLSMDSACQSVRHYQNVYFKCVQLIVIPLSRWQQWRKGLFAFLSASIGEEEGPFAVLCRQCIASQGERFSVVFWGCWSSVGIRLESLMSSLSTATGSEVDEGEHGEGAGGDMYLKEEDEGEENEDNVDLSIARLRGRYFSELYQFQRLAHDAAHLFGSYALVGRSERQWLTDTLLLQRDEKASEALVRRSFKRDFGVPSVDLDSGLLLDEYKSFEVNETKERAMQKRVRDTLKATWFSKARDVFEYEIKVQKDAPSNDEVAALDKSGNEVYDLLLHCLNEKAGRPDLAFAVTMRIILERESFPASVDLSRVEFALGLFLKWFEKYSHERHPGEIPLFLSTDLWTFILERHTELLKWVVFHYCHEEVVTDPSCVLEAVTAVTFSVQRCLAVYVTSLVSRRSSRDAKKQLEDESRKMVCDWVQNTIVNTFLHGIEHLCTPVVKGVSEIISNNSLHVSQTLLAARVGVVKAQLLLLCDVPSLAMDARRMLLSILDIGFKQMKAVSGSCAAANMSETTFQWTICMISVLNSLCHSLFHSGDGIEGSQQEWVDALHAHYRNLLQLSSSSTTDLITNAWIDFLSREGKGALGSHKASLVDITRARHSLKYRHHGDGGSDGDGKKNGKERRGKRQRDE